jgi:hypothetical protein
MTPSVHWNYRDQFLSLASNAADAHTAISPSLPLTGARVQTAVYFVLQTFDRGIGDCGQPALAAQFARQSLQPALSP